MNSRPDVRDRLRVALRFAMKERDRVAVAALRSTLGVIDDAEAVDIGGGPTAGAIEESAVGLGAAEVARREIGEPEMEAIVGKEIDERRRIAEQYDRAERRDRADILRREAETLEAVLAG